MNVQWSVTYWSVTIPSFKKNSLSCNSSQLLPYPFLQQKFRHMEMCKTRVSVSLILWILFSVFLSQPHTKLLPAVTQSYLLSLVYTTEKGTSPRSRGFSYFNSNTHSVGLRNKAPKGKTMRNSLPYAFSIHGGSLGATWTWDTSSGSLFSSWAQGEQPWLCLDISSRKGCTCRKPAAAVAPVHWLWLGLTCITFRV